MKIFISVVMIFFLIVIIFSSIYEISKSNKKLKELKKCTKSLRFLENYLSDKNLTLKSQFYDRMPEDNVPVFLILRGEKYNKVVNGRRNNGYWEISELSDVPPILDNNSKWELLDSNWKVYSWVEHI